MKTSLRHLRILLAVTETASLTRAAAQNHVSQPAVSAAIQGIEAALGADMFDRRPQGLTPTPAGAAAALRIRRALAGLDPALASLSPRLKHRATLAQLTALIAVAECENFTAAARQLGLAQPTVHRAVRQLETEVGYSLFDRTAYGVIPSRAVRHLVTAACLAQTELAQMAADIADLARQDLGQDLGPDLGREVGQVVIGAMPLSRSVLLGPAIAQFRTQWKTLSIRVIDGPYSDLALALRRGSVDMLVGALRPLQPDIRQEVLLQDEMVIVARPNHPLTKGNPQPADMLGCPWVVAAMGTPARDHFDAMFHAMRLTSPPNLVETGSMELLCDLVGRSDHLGFVSALQARQDIARGTLAQVPFHPQGTLRPIGVTTRQNWHPTRAQADMIKALRAVVQ